MDSDTKIETTGAASELLSAVAHLGKLVADLTSEVKQNQTETAMNMQHLEARFVMLERENASTPSEDHLQDPRRESFMFRPQPLVQPKTPASLVTAGAPVQFLAPVDPKRIVEHISWAALRQTIDNRDAHSYENNQDRPVAQFLHRILVCRALVQNEQRCDRNHGLTEHNILHYPDSQVIAMYAAYIRAHHMVTRRDFGTSLVGSVPPLRPKSQKWQWGVKDWDVEMYPRLHKHMQSLERTVGHIYKNATEQEMNQWPAKVWGKGETNHGLIQLLHATLGDFQGHFEQSIGLENLKAMTTPEAYFKAVSKVNVEYANLAHKLRQAEARITPGVKLKDVIEEVAVSRSRRPLHVESRGDNQQPQSMQSPMPGPFGNQPSGASSPYTDQETRGHTPVHGRHIPNTGDSSRFRVHGLLARNEAIDEDEEFRSDESIYSDGPSYRQDDDHHPHNLRNSADHAREYGEYNNSRKTHFSRERDHTLTVRKPCRRYFNTMDCAGDCGRSHDVEDMHQCRDRLFAELVASPWVTMEWLEDAMARLQHDAGTEVQQEEARRIAAVKRLMSPLYPDANGSS